MESAQIVSITPANSSMPEPNKLPVTESVKVEVEVDILKALYAELSNQLKFTSERSFTSTIQTITLNLVVLGGLIINKLSLSEQAKLLGSIMLCSFNISILSYILSKGTAYSKVKRELLTVRAALANKCPSLDVSVIQTEPSRTAFLKGTGLMFLATTISCICTICGFWLKLATTTDAHKLIQPTPIERSQPTVTRSMSDSAIHKPKLR